MSLDSGRSVIVSPALATKWSLLATGAAFEPPGMICTTSSSVVDSVPSLTVTATERLPGLPVPRSRTET